MSAAGQPVRVEPVRATVVAPVGAIDRGHVVRVVADQGQAVEHRRPARHVAIDDARTRGPAAAATSRRSRSADRSRAGRSRPAGSPGRSSLDIALLCHASPDRSTAARRRDQGCRSPLRSGEVPRASRSPLARACSSRSRVGLRRRPRAADRADAGAGRGRPGRHRRPDPARNRHTGRNPAIACTGDVHRRRPAPTSRTRRRGARSTRGCCTVSRGLVTGARRRRHDRDRRVSGLGQRHRRPRRSGRRTAVPITGVVLDAEARHPLVDAQVSDNRGLVVPDGWQGLFQPGRSHGPFHRSSARQFGYETAVVNLGALAGATRVEVRLRPNPGDYIERQMTGDVHEVEGHDWADVTLRVVDPGRRRVRRHRPLARLQPCRLTGDLRQERRDVRRRRTARARARACASSCRRRRSSSPFAATARSAGS